MPKLNLNYYYNFQNDHLHSKYELNFRSTQAIPICFTRKKYINSTHLGPQHVARDETLELLLGRAPCDSNSVIIPCTTFIFPKKHTSNTKFTQINQKSHKKTNIKELNSPCGNPSTERNRKSATLYRNPKSTFQ